MGMWAAQCCLNFLNCGSASLASAGRNRVLGWPQSSLRFCCDSLLKQPNELFGLPSSVSKGKRV